MQVKKQNIDSILAWFIDAFEKRYFDTKVALKNQQPSILNIENKIGKYFQLINGRLIGTFSTSTKSRW